MTTMPRSLNETKGLIRERERHFAPPAVEHLAVVTNRHQQDLEACDVLSRLVDVEVQVARIDEHQRPHVRPGLGVMTED